MAKHIEASPKIVKDMGKWLRENLFLVRDDGAEGRFSRVRIFHVVKGGSKKGEQVNYLDVPKKANDDWCDNTALEIYTRLQSEASTLPGLQQYAVYAYCAGDSENHVSRFLLRMQGADNSDDDMVTETPDKGGLTAMSMRHTEAQAKINVSLVMTTQAAQSQLIARQATMLERLMDMRFASMEREEELVTRKHEREIELMQAESKAKAIREIGSKLGLFIPALMNKVAGQQLFPVQANAVLMMTKGLLTGIASDESRMAQFMTFLKPEEAVAFMNILEEVSRKIDDAGLPVDPTQTNGATATQETKG